jgi:hypothetical protein
LEDIKERRGTSLRRAELVCELTASRGVPACAVELMLNFEVARQDSQAASEGLADTRRAPEPDQRYTAVYADAYRH